MKKRLMKKWQGIQQSLFFSYLERTELNCGSLSIRYQSNSYHFQGHDDGPNAAIEIHSPNFFTKVIMQGDIGLGEAYMDNDFSCNDIKSFISFFILNPTLTQQGSGLVPSLKNVKDYLCHLLRDNGITQGKKNIEAHYDIGNDFYQTFLDSTMMYSSAIFTSPEQSLHDAQINKLDYLISKARIKDTDHVLEIGSGWGSFAIRAAQTRGCRVTTITLSNEQLHFTRKRVLELGLAEQVKVELIDYRMMKGKFDKIVSIEMIEAVGHRHLKSYIKQIEKLLAPQGTATIQMITIPDYRYKSYLHSSDWIRKYIFPGGHLPSISAISKVMEKNSRLFIEELENIAPHYAETLLRWNNNFCRKSLELAKEKFGSRFIRMWEYYLLSCSAAFSTRYLNTHIMTLSHDRNVSLNCGQLGKEKIDMTERELTANNSRENTNQYQMQ